MGGERVGGCGGDALLGWGTRGVAAVTTGRW